LCATKKKSKQPSSPFFIGVLKSFPFQSQPISGKQTKKIVCDDFGMSNME